MKLIRREEKDMQIQRWQGVSFRSLHAHIPMPPFCSGIHISTTTNSNTVHIYANINREEKTTIWRVNGSIVITLCSRFLPSHKTIKILLIWKTDNCSYNYYYVFYCSIVSLSWFSHHTYTVASTMCAHYSLNMHTKKQKKVLEWEKVDGLLSPPPLLSLLFFIVVSVSTSSRQRSFFFFLFFLKMHSHHHCFGRVFCI